MMGKRWGHDGAGENYPTPDNTKPNRGEATTADIDAAVNKALTSADTIRFVAERVAYHMRVDSKAIVAVEDIENGLRNCWWTMLEKLGVKL